MIRKRIFILAAALVAAGSLTGCASNFQANVTRFHETLPPPEQGASFAVLPDDPKNEGSLEFGHYADLVADRLTALGYTRAADAASARLTVHLSYDVDKGHDRTVSTGLRRGFFSPTIYPVYYRTPRGVVVRYVTSYNDPLPVGL